MAVNNITDGFIYEIPNKTVAPRDVMFNLPMQYTGGHYLNIWLFGLFGVLFLGGLQFGQGGKKSSLYASFGTWMVTFLLTLAGIAGGKQLIPATGVMIALIIANYVGGGPSV